MAIFACSSGAARTEPSPRVACLLGVLLLLLGGCAATPPQSAQAPPPPPKQAQPLEPAVLSLAEALLTRTTLPPGPPRPLVIDPLIDRATGTETAATRAMSSRIAAVVEARHPDFRLRPFNTATLSEQPLVLLGAISAVEAPGSLKNTAAPPGAYRIWAVLADLSTGRIVGHETAWVQAEAVDATPTAFHADSPAWVADARTTAYLKVCAGNPGDPIDPQWLAALRAEALLAEATAAYEAGQPDAALGLFTRARAEPGGGQLRAFNGIYLANVALGRRTAAEDAFAELVGYGLERQRLAVKFLFRPGGAAFWPDPAISGPYPMWLRQIARRTEASGACLEVTGHTSPTGTPAANDRISRARADRIRDRLVTERHDLARRTAAVGAGASQPIIGTGRDDATDLLDRRVEFRPMACARLTLAGAVGAS